MYKSKAYKKNDSSTVEMDLLELHRAILELHRAILELHRAILEGKNLSYEQLDYDGDLNFETFKEKLKRLIGISLNNDILKTFGLINDNGKYSK